MKAIPFVLLLMFSGITYSATFEVVTGGADNPEGGHYEYCIEHVCTFGYKDPYIYRNAVDPGYIDDELYFAIGTDLVDRSMSTGISLAFRSETLVPTRLAFSWRTFDVFNANIFYDGNSIVLPGNGFGTFEYTFLTGPYPYTTHFAIGGKANSLDSYLEFSFYEVQPPSEVPIPAALYLFAPALLGFLGLRRKRS